MNIELTPDQIANGTDVSEFIDKIKAGLQYGLSDEEITDMVSKAYPKANDYAIVWEQAFSTNSSNPLLHFIGVMRDNLNKVSIPARKSFLSGLADFFGQVVAEIPWDKVAEGAMHFLWSKFVDGKVTL